MKGNWTPDTADVESGTIWAWDKGPSPDLQQEGFCSVILEYVSCSQLQNIPLYHFFGVVDITFNPQIPQYPLRLSQEPCFSIILRNARTSRPPL